MVSGPLLCLILFYRQGNRVDLGYGVGRGSWDKISERFLRDIRLWQSGCGYAFLEILIHISAWTPCKNMRGNVTLGVGKADLFSLAAMMGPEAIRS